jgi:hypothetical protein
VKTLALLVLLAAGPGPVAPPAPGLPGDVIVVNAAANTETTTVNGVSTGPLPPAGIGSPIRLLPGQVQVVVHSTDGERIATIDSGPGCTTIAVVRPADQPTPVVAVPYCPLARIPSGQASLVAINAASHATPSIALRTAATVQSEPAAPWTGTPPINLPPGQTSVSIARTGLGVIRQLPTTLEPNTAYALVLVGGGEQPVQTPIMTLGVQPPNPVPPGTRINTDRGPNPVRHSAVPTIMVIVLLGMLGCTLILRHRRWAAAAVLAVVVSGCANSMSGVGATRGPDQPTGPSPVSIPGSGLGTTSAAGPIRPVRIEISAIGMNSTITPYPTEAADRLNTLLPNDQVAWISGTDVPGQAGSAMLAGHITGVFANLHDLAPGNKVIVNMSNGSAVTFTVESDEEAPKGHLETIAPSLDAPTATPLLYLVTCSGTIGPDGLHEDNLIVVASPTTAAT